MLRRELAVELRLGGGFFKFDFNTSDRSTKMKNTYFLKNCVYLHCLMNNTLAYIISAIVLYYMALLIF